MYEEFLPKVRRLARRLGVSDEGLEDVCQEVFLAVYRRLPTFRGDASFSTWFHAFVYNTVRSHHRTRRRRLRRQSDAPDALDLDSVPSLAPSPFDTASRDELLLLADALLDTLDEAQGQVYFLTEAWGMTAPEVAEATHKSVRTVRRLLRGARDTIAKARPGLTSSGAANRRAAP
jgi:RNA polymerase sigma-70 factor (ECF subfamily)